MNKLKAGIFRTECHGCGWVGAAREWSERGREEKGNDRLRMVEMREGLVQGIVGLPPECRMRSMGYGIVLGSPRGISACALWVMTRKPRAKLLDTLN